MPLQIETSGVTHVFFTFDCKDREDITCKNTSSCCECAICHCWCDDVNTGKSLLWLIHIVNETKVVISDAHSHHYMLVFKELPFYHLNYCWWFIVKFSCWFCMNAFLFIFAFLKRYWFTSNSRWKQFKINKVKLNGWDCSFERKNNINIFRILNKIWRQWAWCPWWWHNRCVGQRRFLVCVSYGPLGKKRIKERLTSKELDVRSPILSKQPPLEQTLIEWLEAKQRLRTNAKHQLIPSPS